MTTYEIQNESCYEQDRSEYDSENQEMEITYEYDPVSGIFLKNYKKKTSDEGMSNVVADSNKTTDQDTSDVGTSDVVADSEESIEHITNALWEMDDKEYWQKGILLEKGAALGDFLCKLKLATWLESIDSTKSIELFEELLTTSGLRFDDNSSIHFHLGKLYMSRYNWEVAYKHFSDAYGIGDAKIAMGVLKHFGLVGIPDTGKAVQCFDEAARRYHYSEKELRQICDRFSTEFKKQQEQEQLIKRQQAEIESQRVKIENLERQLFYLAQHHRLQ
jgi:hypothetical protein